MSDLVCAQCGHANPIDGNFCSVCGAALVPENDESRTETHSAIEFPEDDGAMLVVVRGENAGSRYGLGAPVTTIGRHPDSDVFLDDVTVSRNHAVVTCEDDAYVIADRGSLNGTYVNRRRIERQTLLDGDELQVGKYKLTFITP